MLDRLKDRNVCELRLDQLATCTLPAPPGQVDPVGGHQGNLAQRPSQCLDILDSTDCGQHHVVPCCDNTHGADLQGHVVVREAQGLQVQGKPVVPVRPLHLGSLE